MSDVKLSEIGIRISELLWLSEQNRPVWGGVYERGGDADINAAERAGLVERVAQPYRVGRINFRGGYRITPAGRAALSKAGGRK